jgi:hypothetical protein
LSVPRKTSSGGLVNLTVVKRLKYSCPFKTPASRSLYTHFASAYA